MKTRTITGTKRILCLVTVVMTLVTAFSGLALTSHAVEEPQKPAHSKAACVYNVDYDTILYEHNIDKPVYPAGTVKMMVALLALEHFTDYEMEITVTEDMLDGLEGSATGFKVGETLSVDQLLSALIIGNSNDAALILACSAAGNSGAFLKQMNERAKQLGMENTRYYNVTGLHTEPMKTTVRDVLTLSRELIKNRKYTELAGTDVFTLSGTNKSGDRIIHNRNVFISTYYNLYYYLASVSGISYSYTGAAGYCMSITATDKSGMNYIFVVMNSNETGAGDTEIYACDDAVALMNWAFRGFSRVTVVDTGTMICEIPVRLSPNTDHVIALPAKKITAFLPNDTDVSQAVTTEYTLISDTLIAPVKAGDVIGSMTVYVNGKDYGQVDLVAKNNVDRSFWSYLGFRAGQFLSRPIVIAALVAGGFLLAAYGVFSSVRRSRRQRRVKFK